MEAPGVFSVRFVVVKGIVTRGYQMKRPSFVSPRFPQLSSVYIDAFNKRQRPSVYQELPEPGPACLAGQFHSHQVSRAW